MTQRRKPIFDAVRAAGGKFDTIADVDDLDAALDRRGVPRDLGTGLSNAPAFFAAVRSSLFDNRMSSAQVDGCDAVLRAADNASWCTSWTAYALATAYHETAKTMQPVREAYWLSEAWRKTNLRYYPHYGRGYVQLTWEAGYAKADKELGLRGALVANLDLAMQPDIAAAIMTRGMSEAWFTSKGLADTLPTERPATYAEFKASRPIINGRDKDDEIAAFALNFQTALGAGGWT